MRAGTSAGPAHWGLAGASRLRPQTPKAPDAGAESAATVVGCARRKAPGLGPHQVADSGEKGLAGLDDVEAGVLQHGAKLVRARVARLEIAEDFEHRRGYQPTERPERRDGAAGGGDLAGRADDARAAPVGHEDG